MLLGLILAAALGSGHGPTIAKLSPAVVWLEMGGSYPERNPTTCSFSVIGHNFGRRDRCRFEGADVATRFRSSRRLDATVTYDRILAKTGQTDGSASITVWDPRLGRSSNALTLTTRFRPLGG